MHEHRKNTRFIVRGDGHFCSHPFMDWAKDKPNVSRITRQRISLNNPKQIWQTKIRGVWHIAEMTEKTRKLFAEIGINFLPELEQNT